MRFLLLLFLACVSFVVEAADIDRESCRKEDDKSVLADCIEAGKYDPCDDAMGKYGIVRCLTSHKVVAERGIERATKEITNKVKMYGIVKRGSVNERGENQPARNHVVEGNKLWKEYTWEHCLLLNELYSVNFRSGETLADCQLRLTRERAKVLEGILANMIQE